MEFISVDEKDIFGNVYTPLNVVFTLVCSHKGYMLVQNKESNYWELPAGSTKSEETLRDCAIRRCKETSCQDARNLNFVGLCKIVFENRKQSEYFVIYAAELDEELPFISNEDTKNIRWYKTGEDIKPICRTCSNIIRFYESDH